MIRAALVLALAASAAAWAAPAPQCEPPRPPATTAAAFDESTLRALDAVVRAELERNPVVGLSAAVSYRGRTWAQGYGVRDLSKRLPVTPETTFRLASITKSFTAIAILQLVEAGRLKLDDDIRALVPSYPQKQWPITIRQLLGHLGGVPHYENSRDGKVQQRLTTAEALALFADRPLEAEPGTDFVYSSYGYNLLGAAVETVSGLPYGDYLQKHIFAPLGMRTTEMDDHRTRTVAHADGYRRIGKTFRPSERIDVSARFAGGGTRGSVNDLIAFGQAVADNRLVSCASTALMQTAMRTKDGRLIDYGMGFATYPLRGHYMVAHAGGQPETTAFLLVLPADDLVVAVATNVEGQGSLVKSISARFVEVLLEDGAVRRDAFAADATDAGMYEALYRIFSYGLAYHRWRQDGPRQRSWEPPVEMAFAQARALLDPALIAQDPIAQREEARRAHEPLKGRTFIRVGVHMAKTLEAWGGPAQLGTYARAGPLAFFLDYQRACVALGCARNLRFDARAADLARLQKSWQEGSVPELERLRLHEAEDPDALWPSVLAAAQRAPTFHPDYSEELFVLAERARERGQRAKELEWLERTILLHPHAAEPLLRLGDAHLRGKKPAEAAKLYRQAFSERPTAPELSATALFDRARRAGSRPARRAILEWATKLHPEDAALWRARADAERRVGNKAAARAAVAKAKALEAAALTSSPQP